MGPSWYWLSFSVIKSNNIIDNGALEYCMGFAYLTFGSHAELHAKITGYFKQKELGFVGQENKILVEGASSQRRIVFLDETFSWCIS